MRKLNAGSVTELREGLIECLASELGSYQRPGLSENPAIWVYDRPLPPGYKVKVASQAAPLIPALEVVIRYRPQFNLLESNFNTRRLDEKYDIYLVFHDSRQPPRQALLSVIASFATASEPQLLPGSDNNVEQYHLTISNKLTISTPQWL